VLFLVYQVWRSTSLSQSKKFCNSFVGCPFLFSLVQNYKNRTRNARAIDKTKEGSSFVALLGFGLGLLSIGTIGGSGSASGARISRTLVRNFPSSSGPLSTAVFFSSVAFLSSDHNTCEHRY